MQDSIRKFIIENFLAGKDDPTFKNDDSFLDSRVIDSTGILELIDFIEDEHGVSVEDDEMTTENFDSVAKVAAYVERKIA
ncbi:MAG: acyl carrier protein [bacterium]|nr:acyl carrier protein [bacterium]